MRQPSIHWRVLKAFALCAGTQKWGRPELQVIEIRRHGDGWALAATSGHVALVGHVADPEPWDGEDDAVYYVSAHIALMSARTRGELPVTFAEPPSPMPFPNVSAVCVMDPSPPVSPCRVGFAAPMLALPAAIGTALGLRKSAIWDITIGSPLGPTVWKPKGYIGDLGLTNLRLVVMPCRLD